MNRLKKIPGLTWLAVLSAPLTLITYLPTHACVNTARPYTFTNPFAIYPVEHKADVSYPLICINKPHPYFSIFVSIFLISFALLCFTRSRRTQSTCKRILFLTGTALALFLLTFILYVQLVVFPSFY